MVINIQDDILKLHALGLLDGLLIDRTTKRNILWATDAHSDLGPRYERDREITADLITGENASIIKTRARKSMEQQSERTRQHGEVSTPLWVCKKMNDHIDAVWFRRKTGINKTDEQGHIFFKRGQTWRHYVDNRRMEITCGEAPFLVNRYDPETGEAIPIRERNGILDRKLRAVSENAQTEEEWLEWSLRAVKASYGYEYQGDSLLIGRVNVLMTFEDHLRERWNRKPTLQEFEAVSYVLSWNLWQMDGLTGMIPYAMAEDDQLSLFPTEPKPPSACRVYIWRQQRGEEYRTMKEAKARMKFDFIIGNPPYQDETLGDNEGYAPPIYHQFLDGAYSLSNKVETIHPARFLFNAGNTPKQWNEKMLSDPHLKVLFYEQNSGKVFPGTYITGGVAITYRDATKTQGPIGTFTPYSELNSIQSKASPADEKDSLMHIIYNQAKFDLEQLYKEYPDFSKVIGSGGRDKRFRNNIFEKINLFTEEKRAEDDISVIGVVNGKRVWRFFPSRFVDKDHENIWSFKAIVSAANGASGTLRNDEAVRVTTVPFIGKPNVGHTQTFISVGAFSAESDAEACVKYMKSKFARVMLGIMKVTQDNKRGAWRCVPLQDFTSSSDIDWSLSIPEIDQQLYAKYGLDETEIAFIESHVKEME